MLAQCSAGVLVQGFHVFGHIFTRDHAHRFDKAEGKAAGKARQPLIARHGGEGFEQRGHFAVNEMLRAAAHLVGYVGASFFVDKDFDLRAQCLAAFDQLAHGGTAPHQATLGGIIHLGVGRVIKTIRPQVKLGLKRPKCRLTQGLRLFRRLGRVLPEPESVQLAYKFATYSDFALVIHLGHEGLLLLQPPQQHAGAPVNKSLRQRQVQAI